MSPQPHFSHGHQPEAGREIQAELNRRIMKKKKNNGPLAKNQPEASVIAVSQL